MTETKTYLDRGREVAHLQVELLTLLYHEYQNAVPEMVGEGVIGVNLGVSALKRIEDLALEDLRDVTASLAGSLFGFLVHNHPDFEGWLRQYSLIGYTIPTDELPFEEDREWVPTPWYDVWTREGPTGKWGFAVKVGGHVVDVSGSAYSSEEEANDAAHAVMGLRSILSNAHEWSKYETESND